MSIQNHTGTETVERQEAMGKNWSAVYDQFDANDVIPTVDFLDQLCGSRQVLELGVGTGRIALPLAQRGNQVHGLDASQDMLEVLRTKDSASMITQLKGDMAAPDVLSGIYGVVYVVNNTLSHLLTQARQMQCIFNVANALDDGGHLVVEGYLPAVEQADQSGEKLLFMNAEEVRIRYAHIDPATQTIRYQIARMAEGSVTLYPMSLRYIWPSELDLMAAAAGLRLTNRQANWHGIPFEDAARTHVSTYIKIPRGHGYE